MYVGFISYTDLVDKHRLILFSCFNLFLTYLINIAEYAVAKEKERLAEITSDLESDGARHRFTVNRYGQMSTPEGLLCKIFNSIIAAF